VVPLQHTYSLIRYKTSERLISHDEQNNAYNYKFTFSVEIAPVCRDDLICLPTKVAQHCGNISPLVICWKISNIIHVIDPWTLQTSEITGQVFWSTPFRGISTHKQLIEYTVLDVTPLGPVNGKVTIHFELSQLTYT
jgi:nonsense-mediated mRNA decay protein 3